MEFHQTNSYSHYLQVTKIIGDGTSENDITINTVGTPSEAHSSRSEAPTLAAKFIPGSSEDSIDFNTIRLPVSAGILRAGNSMKFPNAQVGLSKKIKDFSIKKELSTGSYYFLNRDSAVEYSGKITDKSHIIENFIQFAQQFLGEPFPALILGDMQLNEKTALYAYFSSMPVTTFSNKSDQIREASFTLKEVL